ncbi:usick-Kaufman Bardet-Biedl syndromes chaperonin [Pelobates cultripes]|uniref:Usick-Kaufman Bardet-Biedl syndromes chaperonin n=1 Tax=Pelobates cultripes TaxID=61616 RepID=A0AAD1VWX0_PELCU|nr:usick-Kaufman Bardet-Biedl syndromes chaperonin [Pelobates cultripes]
MSRFEPKKQSMCTAGPLSSKSIQEPLRVLHGIVRSCYGPSGRLKQVHNGTGGCVVTTSQSSTLLASISLRHPVLKLLVASVRSHISCFSDCGLFAANLCCSLTDRFLDLNISPHTIVAITRSLLATCIDYVNSEHCGCKMAADFSSSTFLLRLTGSVLSSKPACMLTYREADFISTLLVKAFLLTIPNETGSSVKLGKCVFVPVEGLSVTESSIVPGLLIKMHELSWNRSVDFNGSPIKLALFSVSLSGDFCDTGEGTVELLSGVNTERAMLDHLFMLAKQLVEDHVNCVVCQKVIHPSVKQYLKEKNVLVLDRLGAAPMDTLSQMSGAKPIASLSVVSSTCCGRLREFRRMSYGSHHYLHFIPFDTSVSSFVLCNRNETSLKELMTTCQAAQHILLLTLKKPWVLLGGGCTETHLAAFIRYKSANIQSSCLKELKCSASEYQLVSNCFCASLESVARSFEHKGGEMMIDLQDAHLWSVPPSGSSEIDHNCGCGIHRSRDSLKWNVVGSQYEPFNPQTSQNILPTAADQLILDCFSAKCNGLQVAVDTAALILDLSYIVEDQN